MTFTDAALILQHRKPYQVIAGACVAIRTLERVHEHSLAESYGALRAMHTPLYAHFRAVTDARREALGIIEGLVLTEKIFRNDLGYVVILPVQTRELTLRLRHRYSWSHEEFRAAASIVARIRDARAGERLTVDGPPIRPLIRLVN